MKEKTFKMILLSIVFVIAVSLIPNITLAENNANVILLQKGENDYIIYSETVLNKEFEFAFSENSNEIEANLNFINSAKDNNGENANNVAYINDAIYTTYLEGKTSIYLYIKYLDESNTEKIEVYSLDTAEAVTENQIVLVNNITKRIETDTKATIVNETVENDVKVTVTKGAVKVDPENKNEEGTYEYQIITLPMSDDYTRFVELANTIANLDSTTNMYNKLSIVKEFYNLYMNLKPTTGWLDVENKIISQPANAKENEQYIVWIREDGTVVDVQFLTSYEEHKEEKIKEEVEIKETSKLPVTYDNSTLFIVLAVIIVAIVLVLVVRTVVTKRSKNEE